MIPQLPLYIVLIFVCITLITLALLYRILQKSSNPKTQGFAWKILLIAMGWLIVQAILTFNKTYSSNLNAMPPRIVLFGVLPMIVVIVFVFATKSGRKMVDSLPLGYLTALHTIRIPVELVLYWLFIQGAVPQIMTFEGRNFDILAGISAPLMAYLFIIGKSIAPKTLLVWNVIALGLLINIVVLAVLSAPTPLQKLAFDQPNTAILFFPFSWLPTFVVPVVAFSHIAAIRKILAGKSI